MKAKKITGSRIVKSVLPDDTANHKIYSVNTSNSLGGGNRTKRITITGIPGSTFTLLPQDQTGDVYSFNHNTFGGKSPSPLRGVIPPSGVFRKTINTGRSTQVQVRVQSAAPDAITQVITQSVGLKQLTLGVDGTGLSNYTITGATSHVGPSLIDGASGVIFFTFVVKANTEKLVNYVRAPRFNYDASTPGGFVLYDGVAFSSNELAHNYNDNGIQLQSDFKIIEAAGWETTGFKIPKIVVEAPNGFGEIPDASIGHSTWVSDTAIINGAVEIGDMGNENLTVNLMLYNFLEIL